MLRVNGIILPLAFAENEILRSVSEKLRVKEEEIRDIKIEKRETVKGEGGVYYKFTLLVTLCDSLEKRLALVLRKKGVSRVVEDAFSVKRRSSPKRPVVVGFGPAGIFASLVLAMAGLSPIVLERGEPSEKRALTVERFKTLGVLDPESNIQFGEGGAGSFSDGKLKIGLKDGRKRFILQELVEAGADESILYLEKAHVGSDVLQRVVVNLRRKIEALGGEIIFGAKFTSPIIEGGRVTGAEYEKGGATHTLDTDSLILATGHSARDTIEALFSLGLKMESKGFGIGVRIEHPQGLINSLEYGGDASSPLLPPADYKMVTHLKSGRSLYTFCMCPGGFVVPAASEEKRICTNGMSNFKRDGENANTALLVSVLPTDFDGRDALGGIRLQREIESLAFTLAGGDYKAPVIRLEDFLSRRESARLGDVLPTYKPGTALLSPDNYLPSFITEALRDGLRDMGDYKKGYLYPDAVLTGPETRTTSPVKMVREDFESVSFSGLYPAGEGAGYSGGIISSAVDGIAVAEKLLDKI